MFKWRRPVLALSLAVAVGLHPTSGKGQDIDIIMALPAQTLTFSSAFIAEDAGFYKKEGLKVSHRFLVGVASPNAVLAGSADFTIGTGPVFLRAAAQGQRMLAIANLIDKPLVELVLRKDVAEAGEDHRRHADRRARQGAARQDRRHPGRGQHRARLGAAGGQPRRARRREGRPHRADGPARDAARRSRTRRSTATPPRCRSPRRRS